MLQAINGTENGDLGRDAAVKAMQASERPDRLILGNGIVLKIKQVPPLLVRRAQAQIRRPEPPTMFLEDKGRSEVNPNHPDYLKALEDYDEQVNEAGLNILLLAGTSVESIPDGFSKVDDEDWVEMLAAVGVEPKIDTKPARYLAWLQFVAVSSINDFFRVGEAVGRLSGLTEEDVQVAVDSFRRPEGRPADNGLAVEPGVTDGDNLPPSDLGAGA